MTTGQSDRFKTDLIGAIPNLRAFAISLCSDSHLANDLVQDTLLKAWLHRGKYIDGTNLKAWLFTILRNTYFSQFRKARRERAGNASLMHTEDGPIPQLAYLELADLQRSLATLSDDQREAVLLVGAEGFSYEEAAEIAGSAVGTMKSRVNRARNKLAKLMIGEAPISAAPADRSAEATAARMLQRSANQAQFERVSVKADQD